MPTIGTTKLLLHNTKRHYGTAPTLAFSERARGYLLHCCPQLLRNATSYHLNRLCTNNTQNKMAVVTRTLSTLTVDPVERVMEDLLNGGDSLCQPLHNLQQAHQDVGVELLEEPEAMARRRSVHRRLEGGGGGECLPRNKYHVHADTSEHEHDSALDTGNTFS